MSVRGERAVLRVFLAMLIGVACCAPRPARAFVLGPSEWPTSGGGAINVTYGYSNLFTQPLQGGLSNNEIRAAVEEALLLWSSYAPLNFTQVNSSNTTVNDETSIISPQIRIGNHSIDGDGQVLAHAYYPGAGLGGDLHIDLDEAWALTPGGATFDLLEVLVHEFGHALGLDHDPVHQAIMQPFYIGRYSGPGTAFLFDDDIAGIQARYSTGTGSVKTLMTWTGNLNATFAANGNWFGNAIPSNNITADVAVFDNPTGILQPNLTASRSIAGIRFNRGGWTLGGSSSTITLGAMGIDSWGAGVNTVLPSINLAVDSSWNVTTNSTLSINGNVSGAGGLQKIGAGRLRLFGNNSYAGATTVTGGVLEFSSGSVTLGSVAVQNGARVEFGGGAAVSPGTYTTSGTGFFSVVGPATIDGITLNGRLDVSGALAGAFNLNNTSVVNVNAGGSWAAGPLAIGGTLAAPSTAGTLNLNGGTLNVTSTLTVWSSGTINLAGGPTEGSTSGGQILLSGGKLAGSGTVGSAVATTTGGTLQATGSLLLTGGLSSSGSAAVITKSGTGTLVISGSQSYAPGTTLNVTAGAVGFESDPGAGGAYLNVRVNAGTSAYFAGSTHVNSLIINGGTIVFGSSAPLGGGASNEIVVSGATAPLDNFDFSLGGASGVSAQPLVPIDHHDEFGPHPYYALPPMLPNAITAPAGSGGNTAAVPEPSTLALALLALGTLAFAHRRAAKNRRSH